MSLNGDVNQQLRTGGAPGLANTRQNAPFDKGSDRLAVDHGGADRRRGDENLKEHEPGVLVKLDEHA